MDDKQRRVFLVIALLVATLALGYVSFSSLGENLVYYWNPTQVVEAGDKAYGASIRLGGVVKEGTMVWDDKSNDLKFEVTDGVQVIKVHAKGAPPQMFREGIGVVVEGTLVKGGIFESSRLMVKHSNEYKAPQAGVEAKDLYKTVEGI